MACEQRAQSHQQSTQMLPRTVATEQQSVLVVKKLLAIAVSSITYLRGLFPEKAYGSKYVEEQKVMILREERTCPGAGQVVQWLQGCFDALQKRYLRMILLSMYSDPEHPENVTECYQFKIQYTEKGPRLDFGSESHKNVTKVACKDIKKASILLVRKLYTLMQYLGPLPDSVCLNMKLCYYDEVTPQDYQPPGFKEGENSIVVFQKEQVNLRMGEVVTPFHILKVDLTTERERLEKVDDDDEPLKINEEELECVSKGFAFKENVVIDTGIENSDLSKEEMLENSQFMRIKDTLPSSTEKKKVSRFHFSLSQDSLPGAPKRRKFSVPKENH